MVVAVLASVCFQGLIPREAKNVVYDGARGVSLALESKKDEYSTIVRLLTEARIRVELNTLSPGMTDYITPVYYSRAVNLLKRRGVEFMASSAPWDSRLKLLKNGAVIRSAPPGEELVAAVDADDYFTVREVLGRLRLVGVNAYQERDWPEYIYVKRRDVARAIGVLRRVYRSHQYAIGMAPEWLVVPAPSRYRSVDVKKYGLSQLSIPPAIRKGVGALLYDDLQAYPRVKSLAYWPRFYDSGAGRARGYDVVVVLGNAERKRRKVWMAISGGGATREAMLDFTIRCARHEVPR